MHRDSNVKSAADDGIKMQKKCETIIIIKMEPRHILDVAKLEAEIFSVPWSQQAFAGALEMDQAFFYVAQEADVVVGYCGVSLAADEAEITNIATAPGRRRRNIAKRLLQKAMDEAHERGAQRMFLEVRSLNKPAIGLYQKTGFQTVGIRKKYYRHPQDDALVMMYRYADII